MSVFSTKRSVCCLKWLAFPRLSQSVFDKTVQGRKLKAQHYLLWVCPMAAAPAIVLPFSLYPFNLFILAVHAARTVLLYSNCILSIIKACFPWLLWCWNGTKGPIHIRPEVPPHSTTHKSMHIHTFVLTAEFLFIYWQWTWITANISVGQPGIPDWQGPVLYQCPLLAVSGTTELLICCTHGIGATTNTVECFALLRFISKMLEYLLNKSLKTVKSLQQNKLIQITSTTSSLSLLISCSPL